MKKAITLFAVMGLLAVTAFGQKISLNEQQRTKLKQLVASDAEAGGHFQGVQNKADAALNDKPNPIQTFQSEGRLANDPAKIRTRESVADMHKMISLAYAYAVTEKTAYLQKATDFLVSWAEVNRSSGNSVDDTALINAIFAFDLIQQQMQASDKKSVEKWFRQVADAELKADVHNYNNWNSIRVEIIGLIGFALDDKKIIRKALGDFKAQIGRNLNNDGSSIDFDKRDALHYHVYDIQPLLTLAIAAQMNGVDLYHYKAGGATLQSGVAFLYPFCEGKKVHEEFVNSKVEFDRKRAEAGEAGYKPHPWDPKQAVDVLTLNSYFDKEKSYAMLKTVGMNFTNYPNWAAVVLEAQNTK